MALSSVLFRCLGAFFVDSPTPPGVNETLGFRFLAVVGWLAGSRSMAISVLCICLCGLEKKKRAEGGGSREEWRGGRRRAAEDVEEEEEGEEAWEKGLALEGFRHLKTHRLTHSLPPAPRLPPLTTTKTNQKIVYSSCLPAIETS